MDDDIRISEITLVNYRQYHGTVTVKFPTDENVFAILVGANGAGKSNFWNAIHWCLFGNEPHIKASNAPSIINMTALYEAEKGNDKRLETSVQIIMQVGDTKYLIQRRWQGLLEFLKRDDNNVLVMSKEDLVPYGVWIEKKSELFQRSQKSGPWDNLSDDHDFRYLVTKHIIPEKLSHFFILDGEFLHDLFNEFQDIKSGIDQISQIYILNDALELMEVTRFPTKNRGNKDVVAIDRKIKRIEQFLNSEDYGGVVQTSTTECIYDTDEPIHSSGEPRRSDLKRSIEAIEKRISSLDDEISTSKAIKKMGLRKEFDDVTKDKQQVGEQLEELVGKHLKRLIIDGPFIMCKSSVEAASGMIRAEMERGKLPNIPRRVLVAGLLDKKECLCGTRLDDGTDARRHVENEMDEIKNEARYDIANDMLHHSKQFLKNYDAVLHGMDEEMTNIQRTRKHHDKLGGRINNLKQNLPKEDVNYGRLIVERDDLKNKRKELETDLINTENEIKLKTQEKGGEIRRRKAFDRHTREERKESILLEKPEIIKSKMRKIKEDVEKTIRDEVSRETLRIFNNLSWKTNYARLEIDKEYQIRVSDDDGFEIAGGMAAGEKLFLALSFIMALKRVTNYKFPFIIDSPLGKTGGNLRMRFGKHVPELLNGSQLIMLATNTEYNNNPIRPEDSNVDMPSLIDLLKERVAIQEYKIDYDKQKKMAKILTMGRA